MMTIILSCDVMVISSNRNFPSSIYVHIFGPPQCNTVIPPKILHRQVHLILTVLVIKTQKMSENGEIYTAGKILHCRRQ